MRLLLPPQVKSLEAYTKYLVPSLGRRLREEHRVQAPSTSAPLAEAMEAALVAEVAAVRKDHNQKGQQSLAFLFAIIVP